MKHRVLLIAAAACALALTVGGSAAQADDRHSARAARHADQQPLKRGKRTARVRGFVARGGYYSYVDSDVMNTYAGSRGLYGSTNFYRDPFIDRQTTAGPFDHGFFFDSGIGPRGGDAPYPR